jgi:hypothetical protein
VEVAQKMLQGSSFREFKSSLTADKFDCLYSLMCHVLDKPKVEEEEPVKVEQPKEGEPSEAAAPEQNKEAPKEGEAPAAEAPAEAEAAPEVVENPEETAPVPEPEDKEETAEERADRLSRTRVVLIVFKPLCAMAGNKIKYNETIENLNATLPKKIDKIIQLTEKDEITHELLIDGLKLEEAAY